MIRRHKRLVFIFIGSLLHFQLIRLFRLNKVSLNTICKSYSGKGIKTTLKCALNIIRVLKSNMGTARIQHNTFFMVNNEESYSKCSEQAIQLTVLL